MLVVLDTESAACDEEQTANEVDKQLLKEKKKNGFDLFQFATSKSLLLINISFLCKLQFFGGILY